MSKPIVLTASLLIVVGVALGAFAAHGLQSVIEPTEIVLFEKGVKYQIYMGIALLSIGMQADSLHFSLKAFFYINATGVVIFSGLLYFLAFKGVYPHLKILGAFVPVGGTLMIASWIVFIVQLLKKQGNDSK